MRIKLIIAGLVLVGVVSAQNLNYNGYLDTSNITLFAADSLRYSKPFPLAQMENMVVDVMANDTSVAKFGADSLHFIWFVETGHPALDSSGKLDTVWNTVNPVLIDSFHIRAGKYTKTYATLGTDGTFLNTMGLIDTTTLTGFAVQTRSFAPPFDVLFRIGHKGVTGNQATLGKIVLRDAVYRRAAIRVRQN